MLPLPSPHLLLAALLASAAAGCASANHPPVLSPLDDRTIQVGEPRLQIQVLAEDPDGDELTFGLEVVLFAGTSEAVTLGGPPPGGSFTRSPRSALLTWAPSNAEVGRHEFLFRVEDGRGGTASEKVTVTVLPSTGGGGGGEPGAPSFISPSSYVLNLVHADCLDGTVLVKDDDSLEVTLSVLDPPPGLSFRPSGRKEARFSWCPTPEQQRQTVWAFRVVADDGEHAPVEQRITIVIRSKVAGGEGESGEECPGLPPVIEHLPLRNQTGGSPFPVEARITDDGVVQQAFVAFTVTDPADIETYEGALMEPGRDGVFRGLIPDRTAPGGPPVTYYYYVCAVDDDDAAGDACDHFTCVPEEAIYTFVANPAGSGTPEGACRDDAREPDDSRNEAVEVAPGTQPGLWLCPGDEDWFLVRVPEGGSLEAEVVSRSPGGLALGLALHDGDGRELSRSASGREREAVTARGMTGGRAYLRVWSEGFPEGSEGAGYDLTVTARGGAGECPVDEAEPNDSADEAPLVEAGTYDSLVLCPGERDFFGVRLRAGDRLQATVRFSHATGDLDLTLRDGATGAILARSVSDTDTETVTATAVRGGVFLIEVYGYRGASAPYSLEVNLAGGGAADPCSDGGLEPNETPATATRVALGDVLPGLRICQGPPRDEDWYRLPLQAHQGVRIQVSFRHQDGDLDVELYRDGVEGVIASSLSSDDDETISFPGALTPGEYLVRVYGYRGASNGYGLALSEEEGCVRDRAEPNDRAEEAFPLVAGERVLGLSACGDPDFFRVGLPQGKTSLMAGLDHASARGALDLFLYGSDRTTLLDADTTASDSKTVGAAGLPAGPYYLRVAPHGGGGGRGGAGGEGGVANLYELSVEVE